MRETPFLKQSNRYYNTVYLRVAWGIKLPVPDDSGAMTLATTGSRMVFGMSEATQEIRVHWRGAA